MESPATRPLERVLPLLEGALFAFVFGSFETPAFSDESDRDPEVVRGIVRDRLGDLEQIAGALLDRLQPERA